MKAVLRHVRVTPRKMRLVADMVRGKDVNSALSVLKFTEKRGAKLLEKLVRSAIANAEAAQPVNPDVLYIHELLVDPGASWKRHLPRARGRVTPLQKRTSHITVNLAVR